MAKIKIADAADTAPQGQFGKTIVLGNVQQIAPKHLKENPYNVEYFKHLTDSEFDKLKEDIRERGILTPLQAKPDGTLLSGHNRLRAAQELSLQTVPVQYIKSELTDTEERHYIIRDNVQRRHLRHDEMMRLYRMLYPNFDVRREETETYYAALKKGVDNVHPPQEPLTAKTVANDTGQKVATVQKQFQRERKKAQAMPEKQSSASKRQNRFVTSQKLLQHLQLEAKTMTHQERTTLRRMIEELLEGLESD
jgi:ParB-like chromosome segregation protein Spo0J